MLLAGEAQSLAGEMAKVGGLFAFCQCPGKATATT